MKICTWLVSVALGALLLAQAVLPALATCNSGKPLLLPYTPQLDVGSVVQLSLFLLACVLAAGRRITSILLFLRFFPVTYSRSGQISRLVIDEGKG